MNPQVSDIIAKVFRVESGGVSGESSPDTIPNWDSLGHFQLVDALERCFDVKFNIREIQTMDTGARIERVLRNHGKLAAPEPSSPAAPSTPAN